MAREVKMCLRLKPRLVNNFFAKRNISCKRSSATQKEQPKRAGNSDTLASHSQIFQHCPDSLGHGPFLAGNAPCLILFLHVLGVFREDHKKTLPSVWVSHKGKVVHVAKARASLVEEGSPLWKGSLDATSPCPCFACELQEKIARKIRIGSIKQQGAHGLQKACGCCGVGLGQTIFPAVCKLCPCVVEPGRIVINACPRRRKRRLAAVLSLKVMAASHKAITLMPSPPLPLVAGDHSCSSFSFQKSLFPTRLLSASAFLKTSATRKNLKVLQKAKRLSAR